MHDTTPPPGPPAAPPREADMTILSDQAKRIAARPRAVGYARVSTDEQAASGLGLGDQTARIAAYAALRDLDLACTIIDPGESGGTSLADRPGGARLTSLLAARRDAPQHVIILRLDRAFRRASDCLATVEQWQQRGITLHIVDLGGASIDAGSASGRFMLTILAAVAEMERAQGIERTRAALRQKRSRGERAGAIPFGWSLDPGDPRRLIVDPEQQRTLARLRQLHAERLSLRHIATVLNNEQHATQGGKPWQHTSVASILRRPAPAPAVPASAS